jgi:TolB protein
MRNIVRLMLALALVASGSFLVPAEATFPGGNGKIAFIDFRQDPLQIHTIDPDGTGEDQVTSSSQHSSQPEWSADGNRIVFIRSRQVFRGRTMLMTMNANGSGIDTVLSSGPEGRKEILSPAWSPDGSQIVFCAEGRKPPALYVVNTDGSGLTKITRRRHIDCIPSWSPDGTKIAFTTVVGGRWHIATMNPDGSGRERIVTTGINDNADWSPDGSKLVFERRIGRGRYDVFVVNADGSGRTRLTDTPNRWEWTPVFSPDGMRIAFTRGTRRGFAAPGDIWTIAVDGTDATRLTDTPGTDEYGLSWQST